ncbi:hypothetical protein SDC9_155579 [bioreactor metagenome]|uniref:Uncharacterized protein n=1 Tax=bioreactor metagenome TaxID=1076179 RepID=A0A645F262_9ZZZZ
MKGFSFGVNENGAFLMQDGESFAISGGAAMLPLPLSKVLGILDMSVYDSVDVKKDTTEFSCEDPDRKFGMEIAIVNSSKSIKSITVQSGGKEAYLKVTEFSFQ